jgi:hypothetical protein
VRWGVVMLRNLFGERFVVQPMDLLELPVFGSKFKNESLP